jgi:hypothetical protein
VRLPWGELGAAAAASVQGQDAGAAALLSYSYVGRPVLVQVGVRYQSDDYANLSLAPANDRQRLDLTATTAMALWKRANASLQFERAVSRDSGWFNRVTLQCNQTITRWMYAFATVNNTYWQSYPVELSTFVGLSFSVAERTMLIRLGSNVIVSKGWLGIRVTMWVGSFDSLPALRTHVWRRYAVRSAPHFDLIERPPRLPRVGTASLALDAFGEECFAFCFLGLLPLKSPCLPFSFVLLCS